MLTLHDVEPSRVDSDIRLFFKHDFANRRRRLDDWPTEAHLDLLCGRAGGLFIYAFATVKFTGHGGEYPREQSDRILQAPKSSGYEGETVVKTKATLDSLYMSILQENFRGYDPGEYLRLRSIPGVVALATDPLSPSAIASLLGFGVDEVLLHLSLLHSLLIIQEDVDHPVQPFHRSPSDFIIDPTRCTDRMSCISPPDHHSELLIGCLKLMNQTLAVSARRLEVDDSPEWTERCIDQALRCACGSWHKHLAKHTTRTPEIVSALHRSVEVKFSFWIQVLVARMKNVANALGAAKEWLREVCLVSGRMLDPHSSRPG